MHYFFFILIALLLLLHSPRCCVVAPFILLVIVLLLLLLIGILLLALPNTSYYLCLVVAEITKASSLFLTWVLSRLWMKFYSHFSHRKGKSFLILLLLIFLVFFGYTGQLFILLSLKRVSEQVQFSLGGVFITLHLWFSSRNDLPLTQLLSCYRNSHRRNQISFHLEVPLGKNIIDVARSLYVP